MSVLYVTGSKDWTDRDLARYALAKVLKRLEPDAVLLGEDSVACGAAHDLCTLLGIPIEAPPFRSTPAHAVGLGEGTTGRLQRCIERDFKAVLLVSEKWITNLLTGDERDL